MANLKPVEKKYFEEIFDMSSGYVLDHTNVTFAELFRDIVGINIYDDKYAFNGDSKAKRLRAFWEIESDEIVGKVLKELLEIWKYNQEKVDKTVNHDIYKRGLKIVYRLLGKQYYDDGKKVEDFLNRDFEINLSQLNLTSVDKNSQNHFHSRWSIPADPVAGISKYQLTDRL